MYKLKLKNICKTSFVVIFLCGVGASCSVFAPVEAPEVIQYQLQASTTSNANSCKAAKDDNILQVVEVKADAPFNTRKMYYSKAEYQLNSYGYNEWIANPSVMLTQAIQERLLASCIYGNVVNAEFMTIAKYRLTSQLLDFKQVINGQTSTMQLAVLVQLVDNSNNKVTKSKTFNATAEVDATPAGYIKGANAVTETFLTDLTAWLNNS